MRVLVLGFLLMGVSGLLQPLSEPLSFGLDIVGTLIFFAVMVRLMASGASARRPAPRRAQPFATSFAQLSRNPTIRLNTSLPGVESSGSE